MGLHLKHFLNPLKNNYPVIVCSHRKTSAVPTKTDVCYMHRKYIYVSLDLQLCMKYTYNAIVHVRETIYYLRYTISWHKWILLIFKVWRKQLYTLFLARSL